METFTLPLLWRLNSNGGVQGYECRVEDDKIFRWSWTEPYVDPNSKKKKKEIKKREMNVIYGEIVDKGKSNEKTPYENAVVQAKAKHKEKKDEGYTEEKPEAKKVEKTKGGKKISMRSLGELKTPMLLQKYGFGTKIVPLPDRACVSIKANGLRGFYRTLTDDITSRKDLTYKFFDHLKIGFRCIAKYAEKYLFEKGYRPRGSDKVIIKGIDHELDLPDELGLTFQAKTKILNAKKTKKELNNRVIARVFDLGDQCIVPFEDRYKALCYGYEKYKEEMKLDTCIEIVDCICVDNVQELLESFKRSHNLDIEELLNWLYYKYDENPQKWESNKPLSKVDVIRWMRDKDFHIGRDDIVRLLHRWFVDKLKQEGSVVRNLDGLYQGNDYRSKDVLKYKDFEDEEALVIGYEKAKGEQEGAIVFKLKSEVNGCVYTSVFADEFGVSVNERRKMYLEGDKYIGRIYTVRFQERYETGKPQFPVIVSERTAAILR